MKKITEYSNGKARSGRAGAGLSEEMQSSGKAVARRGEAQLMQSSGKARSGRAKARQGRKRRGDGKAETSIAKEWKRKALRGGVKQ